MSFISYALNLEDVMLWRALQHAGKGFYVDCAAAAPENSITRALYERGWHGVNLAAARDTITALRVQRPADINLQKVAGAGAGRVTVYDVAGAELTLDQARARALSDAGAVVVQRQLEQCTLSDLCAAHAPQQIHFIRIGDEGAALAGLDLARWRPWILVLARATPLPAGARYELAYDDGVNHFYVAAEHPELRAAFATPPSAADGFVLAEDHPFAYPLTAWRARVAALEADVAARQALAEETRTWNEARLVEHEQAAAAREQAAAAREAALQLRAEAAEQRLAAALKYEQDLDNALREARGQCEAAEQLARAQASLQQQHVEAIYRSRSWRITRPLRSFSFRLNAMRARLRSMPAGARAGAATLAKRVVRKLMRAIMARPALSYFVRSQLGRHPRLTNWVRVTVQRTQAPAPTPAMAELAIDPDNMPSSARQVLDDLRRTIKSAHHQ